MAAKNDHSLEFVRIVGPGVEALENRKEQNNYLSVTADILRKSINKVKFRNFRAMNMLRTAAIAQAKQ
jgi:hypothetical protein